MAFMWPLVRLLLLWIASMQHLW